MVTLYDKAKNGKIKVWSINVVGDTIFTRHGYLDGKIKETYRKIVRGKNVGKSNETTPAQQAQSEAQSKVNKQLDKGYVWNIKDLDSVLRLRPMLAKTFDPDKTKLPKQVSFQPKLDGVRCLVVKQDNCVKMLSRNGKDYAKVCWDLARELNNVMRNGEIWDGELYVHDWKFQRIISAVKSEKLDTYKIEFHWFDYPSVQMGFNIRYHEMIHRYIHARVGAPRLQLVSTATFTEPSIEDIMRWQDSCLSQGYEGVMLRDSNADYEFKHRSKSIYKYKEEGFEDGEFKIVGYRAGTGSYNGGVIWKCHIDGKRNRGLKGYFDVRPVGTIKANRKMYRQGWKFVGKMLTVRFQGWTDSHLPRFPVGQGIRDYE